MTVRELRKILFDMENQDALVVVSSPDGLHSPHVEADPEGNVYLSEGDVNYFEMPTNNG